MEHPITSNNCLSITIIGDEEHEDEGLSKLMDKLSRKNPPFAKVREAIIKYILYEND